MQWDERYSEPGYAYGTEPNDYLRSVQSRVPRMQVLSVAEGEGRNAVYLATKGCQVTAVDASSVGLSKAEQLAAEHQVSITPVVSDLNEYDPGEEKWDAVISIFCHLPHTQRARMYQKLVRSLKSGGVLVLEAYIPRQLEFATGGPPSAELMPTLDMLREELQGLVFEQAQELEREVVEGTHHFGHAAVVQVFARKP